MSYVEISICEICGELINKIDYEKHNREHQKEKRIKICSICLKTFSNLSNYKYHLAHHKNERPWVCSESNCHKSYKTKIDLLQHQRTHDKRRGETFQCEICEEVFKLRSTFNLHMRRHTTVKGPKQCEECDGIFINLRAHVKEVHQRLREHVCYLCAKEFSKRSGLNRHIQTVHDKLRNWSCDLCEKSFGEKAQMQRHRKTHFKPLTTEFDDFQPEFLEEAIIDEEIIEDKKRFMCGICKKKVNTKAALRRHKAIVHEKKRPWLCDLCPRRYGEKSNLMRHIKTHVDDDEPIIIEKLDEVEEEIFECKSCQKSLTTQWGLKLHEEKCTIKQQINLNKAEEVYQVFIDQEVYQVFIDPEVCQEVKEEVELNVIDDVTFVSLEEDVQYMECDQDESTKRFKCNFCDSTFKEKRYYQQHYRSIHSNSNQNFACNYCTEAFDHRTQRSRHVQQKHPETFELTFEENLDSLKDNSKLTCEHCNKVFKSEKYLQNHVSIQHKAILYECSVCNRKFSFKRSMIRHKMAVHENRRDFKCEESDCDKTFRSRYDLKEHFNKIHAKVMKKVPIQKLTCQECHKVFSSSKILYTHRKLVHEGVRWGNNIYQCKICLETFDTKYKKNKHWAQVHRNGEIKVRTCHHCNSDFKLFEDFKLHIESHTDCIVCITCGQSFTDSAAHFIHQENHRMIDEDLKKFICDVCSHRLSTKGQLEIHMKKHFDMGEYVCDLCGKSYKFIAPFLHHKMVHENVFAFSCSYCQKQFRKKRDLMLHERVHTGERPYKCQMPECGKTFNYKRNYITHTKTHESKELDCKVCNMLFKSNAKLRQHEEVEHPEGFPFRCTCGKSFKVQFSYESHIQKCPAEIDFGTEICDV